MASKPLHGDASRTYPKSYDPLTNPDHDPDIDVLGPKGRTQAMDWDSANRNDVMPGSGGTGSIKSPVPGKPWEQ